MSAATAEEPEPVKWETVTGKQAAVGAGVALSTTARLKVPGGWLYRETLLVAGGSSHATIALCYVSDPFAELLPIRDQARK